MTPEQTSTNVTLPTQPRIVTAPPRPRALREIMKELAAAQDLANSLKEEAKKARKRSTDRAAALLGEAALRPENKRALELLKEKMSHEDRATVEDAAFAAAEKAK